MLVRKISPQDEAGGRAQIVCRRAPRRPAVTRAATRGLLIQLVVVQLMGRRAETKGGGTNWLLEGRLP